ncbi:hypothetical protein NU10_13850 [Flavobacterium dauae]|uniref:hypothetical protein n=1 Tax=Flavobacterium dauae TaxID=1563479 RepID=UPI001F20196E|nr:hypothetical protein [Flavobacterium dauae]WLD23769.1 hypothetical protein NU10_13850 [Flavobacterium dauae]
METWSSTVSNSWFLTGISLPLIKSCAAASSTVPFTYPLPFFTYKWFPSAKDTEGVSLAVAAVNFTLRIL